MTLSFIILLVVLHFIGDFACQTHKMAILKSSEEKWLLRHVVVYNTVMVMGLAVFGYFSFAFCIWNGLLHWGTDHVTSRWNATFWTKGMQTGNMRLFFNSVGFDQLIHMITLFSLAQFFLF